MFNAFVSGFAVFWVEAGGGRGGGWSMFGAEGCGEPEATGSLGTQKSPFEV